jgi:hypothetical protein
MPKNTKNAITRKPGYPYPYGKKFRKSVTKKIKNKGGRMVTSSDGVKYGKKHQK